MQCGRMINLIPYNLRMNVCKHDFRTSEGGRSLALLVMQIATAPPNLSLALFYHWVTSSYHLASHRKEKDSVLFKYQPR